MWEFQGKYFLQGRRRIMVDDNKPSNEKDKDVQKAMWKAKC